MRSENTNPSATALVIGTGGIASALASEIAASAEFSQVLTLGRNTTPRIDYADESSLAAAAAWLAPQTHAAPLRLIFVATGLLHKDGKGPERTWAHMDAAYLAEVFAVNAIGPALVIKHFFPLLPKEGAACVAMLSAKVGSIGDNSLGGWYGYRASKAALNQLVKTAAIELTRRNKNSLCVALHPGTVATALSSPFAKTGLNVRPAPEAAADLLRVVRGLQASATGQFFDYHGAPLPW
jgi:NAD(P)-dependent dehydrogenase (short-subunit alcohol dehydrogenase family)